MSRKKVFKTAEEAVEYLFSEELESGMIVLPPEVDELTDEEGFDDTEALDPSHSLKIQFVAYADFECLTKPNLSCEPSSANSFTMKYQKHESHSFSVYICYMTGMYKYPIVCRGRDAAKVFMGVATKEAREIEYLYSNKKPMIPLTKEQQGVYASSTHCYVCGGNFTKEDWKDRDHCHLTVSQQHWTKNSPLPMRLNTIGLFPGKHLRGRDLNGSRPHWGSPRLEWRVVPPPLTT
ncbi:uncharacterized protein NPIL_471191 [Nephila pilipes]|uniref:Uncharacterized protein n=1 Tax=Nephila pilipes TaxID=299642 RepID=A0A8X6THY2_NEPPI|nr:uncharacterized protein NPIL_471191 [Nephila pilipes]